MIDIHTHVMPGIDDGSESMDMSLQMLAIAAESGVHTIVATPHCNIPDEYENYAGDEMMSLWRQLESAAAEAQIPVKLCRGMEIFATEDLPELLTERRVWTINDTKYFLLEFSFGEDPDFCRYILRKASDLGFRPIIAHPERYFFLQDDPDLAYEFCVSGYGLQVNKGSLMGRFGPGPKRTADLILDHGLCACVASDAHRPYERSTFMADLRDYLEEEYGEAYMRLLLEENPARILSGRDLLGFEPIPFR